MKNHDFLSKTISGGIADRQWILEQVLVGERAPAVRTKKKPAVLAFAGWACTACLSIVILFGYFEDNITTSKFEKAPTAQQEAGAFEDEALTADVSPQVPQPPTALFEAAPAEAAGEQPRGRGDGWVVTNPKLYAEGLAPPSIPEVEALPGHIYYRRDQNESSSGATSPGKPNSPKPDNPGKPDNPDGGETNPDTGGGSNVAATYSYEQFCAVTAYRPLVPTVLPGGFAPVPVPVQVMENGTAMLYYENAPHNADGWIELLLQKLPPLKAVRGGPSPVPPAIRVEHSEEITPALLRKLDNNAASYEKRPAVTFLLGIRQFEFEFISQNVTYEQAAQMLQSLPLLIDGGANS